MSKVTELLFCKENYNAYSKSQFMRLHSFFFHKEPLLSEKAHHDDNPQHDEVSFQIIF